MKIISIVGARPQFVKAAALSRVLRKTHTEILLHTGQHYDDNMSKVFFDELEIPEPDMNLGIREASHAGQTGAMLMGIEEILLKEQPDWTLIYGDTNSTLAGALAAAKLNIPVAHVEAGLRSFNEYMPEEINRVIADTLSRLLFCPSETARANLEKEGITAGVHVVGDIMLDALLHARELAEKKSDVIDRLRLTEESYFLATVHRAENTDDPCRLKEIISAFNSLDERVVFPVHPRTSKKLSELGIKLADNVMAIDPVGYLDMVMLERSARVILTDSGGMQKEAYWLGVPCVTLRDETEWVETVEARWNILTGANAQLIMESTSNVPPSEKPMIYGDGKTSFQIERILADT